MCTFTGSLGVPWVSQVDLVAVESTTLDGFQLFPNRATEDTQGRCSLRAIGLVDPNSL
jgi:hypothetical protein